jgi:phosphatidate phosphatase APP1
MKLNESQLYSALNEFIDREIMPLGATMNLTEQFVFGFKVGIAKRKIQNVVKGYLAKKEMKTFDLVDENGYVDIEVMYQSACDVMNQMKQIEVAGITFRDTDLQKLYGVMQKYSTQI